MRKTEKFISATEDGSVGTKGNVMDAMPGERLDADVIYACGPTPMLRAIKAICSRKNTSSATFPWKRGWPAESVPVLPAYASQKK